MSHASSAFESAPQTCLPPQEELRDEHDPMGQGIQPNYQVCFPYGNVNNYRGANHKPFMAQGTFNREHLSQPFSSMDLQCAFDAAVAAG